MRALGFIDRARQAGDEIIGGGQRWQEGQNWIEPILIVPKDNHFPISDQIPASAGSIPRLTSLNDLSRIRIQDDRATMGSHVVSDGPNPAAAASRNIPGIQIFGGDLAMRGYALNAMCHLNSVP